MPVTLVCPQCHEWIVPGPHVSVEEMTCPVCGAASETISPAVDSESPTIAVAKTVVREPGEDDSLGDDLPLPPLPRQVVQRRLGRAEMQAVDVERFVDNVGRSGLVEPAALQTITDSLGDDFDTVDVDQVASLLVDRGNLTKFQAEMLRRPKPEPLVLGDYVLLAELGAGGMGRVYQARHRVLGRVVALKVLAPQFAHSRTAIARFEREVRASAALDHENIVTVYDVGFDRGRHFFTMQFVRGSSLADLVDGAPLEPLVAAGYMEQVGRGVAEAHEKGILHRDLKPQNVLVDGATDRALVADFGLAKLAEEEELTRSGEVMGTPAYMAPEQSTDSGKVTSATDVYALGSTLYCLLTGRPPFQAANVVETLRLVQDQEPVPPRRLNPAIDRDLETICLKCLEKEPRRRFATAVEVVEELGRVRRGEPILARPVGTLERFNRWCRRNPRLAGTGIAAVVFLVAALVSTTVGYIATSAAQRRAERGYEHARSAVNEFFTVVTEEDLLDQPGLQPLRRKLLEKALAYFREFLEERGDDPQLQDEVADVHYRIALVLEQIDGPESAEAEFLAARTMYERLAKSAPNDIATQRDLGNVFNALGRIRVKRERFEDAVHDYEAAFAIRDAIVDSDEVTPDDRRLLANTLMNVAIADRRRGEAAGETDAGFREYVEQRMQEAQAIRRELLDADTTNDRVRRDRAIGAYNLAVFLDDTRTASGDDVRVLDAYRAARNLFEPLIVEHSRILEYRSNYVNCSRRIADFEADPEAALREYDRALEVASKLARENPTVTRYGIDAAYTSLFAGELALELGDVSRAGELLRASRDEFERLGLVTDGWQHRRNYAKTLYSLAWVALRNRDLESGRGLLERVRPLLEALLAEADDEDVAAELADVERLLSGLPKPDAGSNEP